MLAKSSCNSVRAPSPVETLSPVMTGWFSTAADQSPESPRCVETSPCIKLTRATPWSVLAELHPQATGLRLSRLRVSRLRIGRRRGRASLTTSIGALGCSDGPGPPRRLR